MHQEVISQYELVQKIKRILPEALTGEISHLKMIPFERRVNLNPAREVLDPVAGSVLILLYPENGFIGTILIKRTEDNGVHSGQISFPGGKRDSQDLSPVHTALREAEEEIGIDTGKIEIIGTLSPLYVSPSNFEITPVIGFTKNMGTLLLNPTEVAYTIALPLENIDSYRTHTDISVRGFTLRQVPCFNLGGHIIWGATAMILQELLDVMEKAGVKPPFGV